MKDKLEALEINETWKLTTLPQGKKAIDNKWVYKMKHRSNGSVERLNGRLVARGDKQVKGKDYKDVFLPIAEFSILRVLIALATMQG